MANALDLALMVGVGVAANSLYDVKNNKSAVTPILGGGVLYVSLTVVGGLSGQWKFVIALAFLYLIGSLLIHGQTLIDTATNITKQNPSGGGVSAGAGTARLAE